MGAGAGGSVSFARGARAVAVVHFGARLPKARFAEAGSRHQPAREAVAREPARDPAPEPRSEGAAIDGGRGDGMRALPWRDKEPLPEGGWEGKRLRRSLLAR